MVPSLAMAATAVAICKGVTAIPCPKEFVARLLSVQFQLAGVWTVPAASLESSTPVG